MFICQNSTWVLAVRKYIRISTELSLLGGKSEYDAWFSCRNYSFFDFITCLAVFAHFDLEQIFCHSLIPLSELQRNKVILYFKCMYDGRLTQC
jgi:hypothetical protein